MRAVVLGERERGGAIVGRGGGEVEAVGQEVPGWVVEVEVVVGILVIRILCKM